MPLRNLKDHSRTHSPARTRSPTKYVVILHDGELILLAVLLRREAVHQVRLANGKGTNHTIRDRKQLVSRPGHVLRHFLDGFDVFGFKTASFVS